MTMAGLIKKNRIALFLKDSKNVYNRICKSQELSIAMNAETEDYDFICREMPETVLKYYKPSISQNLVMFKGDAIFEELFDMFYNLATDDDAKRDVMIVFMFDGDNKAGYKAWDIPASSIVFDEMACTDNTLNFNINFGGTINTGTAIITDGHPTFTPASSGMTVDVNSLDMVPGESRTITITGGTAPYNANVDGINDVTATVNDNVVTVSVDVAAQTGMGQITISDSSSPAEEVDVHVTVTAPVITLSPMSLVLQAGGSDTVTITGGTTPYTYNTEMQDITVSISDDTVTVTADAAATPNSGVVTILDSDSPANTADFGVTITE